MGIERNKVMKINWKLRLRNKYTLIALLVAIVGFVYQILGIFGITAPVTEETWVNLITLVCNILVGFGILVDPTTKGLSDSERALDYDEPRG